MQEPPGSLQEDFPPSFVQIRLSDTELSPQHIFFIVFVFLKFPTLELKHNKFEPKIRIIRESSSLETAPKVWKPKFKYKNNDFVCVVRCVPSFSRLPEGYKVRYPVRKQRGLIALMSPNIVKNEPRHFQSSPFKCS